MLFVELPGLLATITRIVYRHGVSCKLQAKQCVETGSLVASASALSPLVLSRTQSKRGNVAASCLCQLLAALLIFT
jgi:hypothetical protein